ncbi:hypothetical protein MBM_01325 [Drepanopeziza brunnea f. sp. 'multigermtubi' MB_m1]|uniref:Uncharacterized protein n=1 Tax=Marssonina brunnea f. sp. multigermtubi (strain MB_m1) TaxID=1072389 RepID=K1XIZ7_MARBU|nr:uncharacterized protein MBM_01325 [Drepanopeziza brunnea f. sp. 'multigermtubi' MB_m1]EKD20643.1 hypothetical protein MBM_01325 [Drepanopeziza brunnea f. sp. 'multigermtubi' MB_m1]
MAEYLRKPIVSLLWLWPALFGVQIEIWKRSFEEAPLASMIPHFGIIQVQVQSKSKSTQNPTFRDSSIPELEGTVRVDPFSLRRPDPQIDHDSCSHSNDDAKSGLDLASTTQLGS